MTDQRTAWGWGLSSVDAAGNTLDVWPYITYLIFCIEMSFVVLKIKGSSNDFIPKI